ncbi:MAG TPA: hypothetical protein VFP23_00325 [Solirubrobacterales bacterium]|nr:hypothetical protein [Solirubrobacterales bacterium]
MERLTGLAWEAGLTAEPGLAARVGAGLWALLAELATDPSLAELVFIEGRRLDSPRYIPYRHMLDAFSGLLEVAVKAQPLESQPPEITARAVVSGAVALISREVEAGRGGELLRLQPELLYLTLVPYLGVDLAEEEMRKARAKLGPDG